MFTGKKRVVSLLPGATEIVWALGAGELLVGRSHECDFPPGVAKLPACTASNIDSTSSSVRIDEQVKTALAQSKPLYRIETALLRQLRPDVIITQAQCEVCAVSLDELEKSLADWPEPHPQIVTLSPNRIADIWEDFRRVAAALDLPDSWRDHLRALKSRVVGVIERACVLTEKPTVACIEWMDPLMAAGNWVPELVELAGGINLFGVAGKHSPWLEWDSFVKSGPEVIVIMPCGFGLKQTRENIGPLIQHPAWKSLRAARSGRVCVADGNQFFNRPGPRIVESLEIMAEICHPGRFNFGHRGKAWEKL